MRRLFCSLESHLPLRWVQFLDGIHGIYHAGGRRELFQSDEIDTIAEQVSAKYPCLVINYENQVGTREARYYADGDLARSFGPDDEVFVLLGEDGEPLVEGQRYSIDELAEEEDYDCIRS